MRRLFDAFAREGYELFLIGGAVRDMAMGLPLRALDDLDFATNARPQETLRILRACRLKTYEMGIEFGTVGAMLTGPASDGFPKDVQVTTYRSGESYAEGSRHPTVRYGDTLAQDLKRRDFAINSIAMDADGRYVDPYDGLGDIRRGVLRVVGDPEETLVEDPLRILRVGRFMAKLGFRPTDDLRLAAFHQAPRLLEISRQRWLQETHKLLTGPHVEPALEFLAETRLLGLLLPEVAALVDLHQRAPLAGAHDDLWARTRRRVAAAGDDRVVSWAALLADTGRPWTRTLDPACATPGDAAAWMGLRAAPPPRDPAPAPATFDHHDRMSALLFKGIARRFHFDNDTADPVLFLLEHQGRAAACDHAWTDAHIRRFVRDAHGHHDALIALDLADAIARHDAPAQTRLHNLQARLRALSDAGALVPRLPSGLGGHLIRGLDLAPGPKLGALIAWLNEAILAGDIDSDLPPQAYIDHLRAAQPPALLDAQQATGPSRGSKPRALK